MDPDRKAPDTVTAPAPAGQAADTAEADGTTAVADQAGQQPTATPTPADVAKAAQDAAADKPVFTQKALDAIVQKRLAEEKTAAAKALKNAQDTAGKQGVELAETQRDQAKAEAEEARATAARSVAEARIEAAVAASGVKADRVDAVAGLLAGQVDAISKAADPRKAAADAVEVAKGSYPEFWQTTGTGTAAASGGELAAGGQPGAVTQEQFAAMSYDQRAKLFSEDQVAYRRLRDAEAAKSGV